MDLFANIIFFIFIFIFTCFISYNSQIIFEENKKNFLNKIKEILKIENIDIFTLDDICYKLQRDNINCFYFKEYFIACFYIEFKTKYFFGEDFVIFKIQNNSKIDCSDTVYDEEKFYDEELFLNRIKKFMI